MNQVILIGRLTRDVQVKQINEHHQVVNNTLAISRKHRDKSGDVITDFIPIVAWDGSATILEKYCQKGQRIAVSGLMQSRTYQSENQGTKYLIECLVQDITLLDRLNKPEQNPPQFTVDFDDVAIG